MNVEISNPVQTKVRPLSGHMKPKKCYTQLVVQISVERAFDFFNNSQVWVVDFFKRTSRVWLFDFLKI
jgi:hypothetical protein